MLIQKLSLVISKNSEVIFWSLLAIYRSCNFLVYIIEVFRVLIFNKFLLLIHANFFDNITFIITTHRQAFEIEGARCVYVRYFDHIPLRANTNTLLIQMHIFYYGKNRKMQFFFKGFDLLKRANGNHQKYYVTCKFTTCIPHSARQ
jgi:hypothetical protein